MEKRSEEGYEEKRGERERERGKVEKKKGAGEKPEKEAVWTRPCAACVVGLLAERGKKATDKKAAVSGRGRVENGRQRPRDKEKKTARGNGS